MAERISKTTSSIRIATFNVSMEALNYLPSELGREAKPTGKELAQALKQNHQQIRNIAEIIQRVNPDIILLNEFDSNDKTHQSLKLFLSEYLAKSQQGENAINFPYFYQGPVNTGVASGFDLNNDNKIGELPSDAFGYGLFPGHFGMALLSKYPIVEDKIRTFQLFKWRDMPNAMMPVSYTHLTLPTSDLV